MICSSQGGASLKIWLEVGEQDNIEDEWPSVTKAIKLFRRLRREMAAGTCMQIGAADCN